MSKTLAMLAVIVSMIFAVSEAQARNPCPNNGVCAPGTCAANGSDRACDVKNCIKRPYCHKG